MLIEVLNKFREDRAYNKRMKNILREGRFAPFFLDSTNIEYSNEWLSLEQLEWLGFKVTPEELMQMTREDIIKMYGNFHVVHEKEEANLAIDLDYNPVTQTTVYQKLVKLANGDWYTLNDVMGHLVKALDGPEDGAILLNV